MQEVAIRDKHVYLLQGKTILEERTQKLLREFAASCGQREAVEDIRYYLGKPGLLKRRPVLALVYSRKAEKKLNPLTQDSLEGAVLLFRYRLAGVSLKVYTSNDRSGRRSVIAAPGKRLEVVHTVTELLEQRGAHAVMLSLRCEADRHGPDQIQSEATKRGSKITRQRTVPDYLALKPTYEATLAGIGKRTRANMRYYRKRAHDLLGCTFEPQLQVSSADLLALNVQCTHPLPPDTILWRLRSLAFFSDPILVALRDKSGDLLSVIGGRRLGDQTELLWQLNRGDLPGHSLSLVLRCCLIEHEISRGVQRFYVEGGTAHSLRNSFVTSTVTDIAVLRRSALTFVLRHSARLLIPWDNELAHLLVSTSGKASGLVSDQEFLSLQEREEKALC